MPALRSLLRGTPAELRVEVLFLLQTYHRDARSAVPELTEALALTNEMVLRLTVSLLGEIGESARPAAPALERLLGKGFDDPAIAQALWEIDRQTNTALRYLTHNIEDFSGQSANTLGRMGAAARPALPFLLGGLESGVGNVRMNSARAVAKIAPEHLPQAVAAVLKPLTNGIANPGSEPKALGPAWRAATVLREFGTNASSARWALEWGAREGPANVAVECRRALEALDVRLPR